MAYALANGGSTFDGQKETSGRGTESMKAGKWEERYKKQVEANNLLHEKLRSTRQQAMRVIGFLKARVNELENPVGQREAVQEEGQAQKQV